MNNEPQESKQTSVKKKNTWLWVIGFIVCFPVPLTILISRQTSFGKTAKMAVIVFFWVVYILLLLCGCGGVFGGKNSDDRTVTMEEVEKVTEKPSNVLEIRFSDPKDVMVKPGETTKNGMVKVTLRNNYVYSEDDVRFISEDPEIAKINFIENSYGKTVFYEIKGLSPGETYVYALSKDNSVRSDKVKVIVPAPIEVEAVEISLSDTTLALGQSVQAKAVITPQGADDQIITWSSDDRTVVSVDDDGTLTAVGGGTTKITAKSSNGVQSTVDVTVDGSRREMNLKVIRSREDDINIGSEWSYLTTINGEKPRSKMVVSVGENLEIYARYTESDELPDVGEASAVYTVTQEDLLNGFSVPMELYATENAGRNQGKSAHFLIRYEFYCD